MFDTFNGLPVHPLVVHGVVVLLPLAILGTIVIAARPRWRVRYGPLVVGAALVATILVPIATSSGESLEEKVGDPGEHAELGDQLLWFALALLLTSAVLVGLQWRMERANARTAPVPVAAGAGLSERPQADPRVDERVDEQAARMQRTWITVSAVIAVLAALACGVQVYRVGDTGARAAWGDAAAAVLVDTP